MYISHQWCDDGCSCVFVIGWLKQSEMPGPGRDLEIRLYRDSLTTPWGFRLSGGKDLKAPLTIQKVPFRYRSFFKVIAYTITTILVLLGINCFCCLKLSMTSLRQVTDFGTNRKLIYDFLLVINTNIPPFLHRF